MIPTKSSANSHLFIFLSELTDQLVIGHFIFFFFRKTKTINNIKIKYYWTLLL